MREDKESGEGKEGRTEGSRGGGQLEVKPLGAGLLPLHNGQEEGKSVVWVQCWCLCVKRKLLEKIEKE